MIAPEDTFWFQGDGLAHIDCRRPRDPSPEERALLFRYCWDHVVASCPVCAESFRQHELGADLLGHRTHMCTRCRTDLTTAVRAHVYQCVQLPAEIRRRAAEAHETALRLTKQSRQLSERADVLLQEAEAAMTALRLTIRRHSSQPDSGGDPGA